MFSYLKNQTLADLYARFMRKWFPKRYAKQGLRRAEADYREQLKTVLPAKREELRHHLLWEIEDWSEWVRGLEDAELVAKAAKMDIHLGDIPPPYSEDQERRSHYEIGSFGNNLLNHETRVALRAKTQERGPAYRKERRETVELWAKIITAITGLGGVAIGIIASLKK